MDFDFLEPVSDSILDFVENLNIQALVNPSSGLATCSDV